MFPLKCYRREYPALITYDRRLTKWLNKGKRKVIDDNAKKQETRKALAEMMNKKTDPFQDLTAEEQIALERGETK